MAPNRTAMIPLVAPAAPAFTGAVLCAASLTASARPMPMKLPELPKFELPKLPELPKLSLPGFGGEKKTPPAPKTKDTAVVTPSSGVVIPSSGVVTPSSGVVKPSSGVVRPKVRVSSTVAPGTSNAPTLAEVTGVAGPKSAIAAGAGWKRFPGRRMPGANMAKWRTAAKEVGPKI